MCDHLDQQTLVVVDEVQRSFFGNQVRHVLLIKSDASAYQASAGSYVFKSSACGLVNGTAQLGHGILVLQLAAAKALHQLDR